jgi:hypothetical protein
MTTDGRLAIVRPEPETRTLKRLSWLAAASFTLFGLLPVVTSSDEVRAHTTAGRFDGEDSVCYVQKNSIVGLLNPGRSPVTVDVTFVGNGGASTRTVSMDGPGTMNVDPGPNFVGSAVVSANQQIVAIVNTVSQTGFGASRCGNTSTFRRAFPFISNDQEFIVYNTGLGTTTVSNYATTPSGMQSPVITATLSVSGTTTTTLRDLDANKLTKPLNMNAFSTQQPIAAFTRYAGPNGLDEVLPGAGFFDGGDQNYLPLGDPRGRNSSGNEPITVTGYVQSTGSGAGSDGTAFVDLLGPDGSVMEVISSTLPTGGNFQFSAVSTSSNPIVAVAIDAQNATAAALYNGLGGSNRVAGRVVSAWPSATASEAIAKKGFAFGAASSSDSEVSLILRNIGKGTARVKVRIFDGDTGKKRQSGKANIRAGGTATIPYKQRARGTNLYADIKVKGKGSVLGWLMRTADGDIDFYPAVSR